MNPNCQTNWTFFRLLPLAYISQLAGTIDLVDPRYPWVEVPPLQRVEVDVVVEGNHRRLLHHCPDCNPACNLNTAVPVALHILHKNYSWVAATIVSVAENEVWMLEQAA